MYPQYWTTSIGGICMKYNNECKQMCERMYREKKYLETPEGIGTKGFRIIIRRWVRRVEEAGPEEIEHKSQNKRWVAVKR